MLSEHGSSAPWSSALQPLTGAYGGLYSLYLRCPFSLGLKSESSEKSEKSSLEDAWRCNDRAVDSGAPRQAGHSGRARP